MPTVRGPRTCPRRSRRLRCDRRLPGLAAGRRIEQTEWTPHRSRKPDRPPTSTIGQTQFVHGARRETPPAPVDYPIATTIRPPIPPPSPDRSPRKDAQRDRTRSAPDRRPPSAPPRPQKPAAPIPASAARPTSPARPARPSSPRGDEKKAARQTPAPRRALRAVDHPSPWTRVRCKASG